MKKFTKKIQLLIFLLLFGESLSLSAQTTLISAAGDGGFETGASFAANGWTSVNHTTNTWQVGSVSTPQAGSNAAYISNDGGTTYSYTHVLQTSHFYRDVTIPAGETKIALTFQWKGSGESLSDRLLIYTAPTTVTPVAGTPANGSTTLTNATLVYTQTAYSQSTYTLGTVTLPAILAGTSVRLIFTWQNDASAGTPPGVSIDNISLTSAAPAEYTWKGTTSDFALATNWTPNRSSIDNSDVLNFDGTTTATPTISTAVNVTNAGKFVFKNNVNATFTSTTGTKTFTLNTGLDIQSGSTVNLSTATPIVGIAFAASSNAVATIAGTLNLTASAANLSTFVTTNSTTTVTGTINNKGTITSATTDLIFGVNGTYNHNHTGASASVVPTATWNAASSVNFPSISSGSSAPTGIGGQTFGHFNWNPTTGANVNLNLSSNFTIAGNATIACPSSTSLRLTGATAATMTISGNLTINTNATLLGTSSSGSPTITVAGNFTNDGTLTFASSSSGAGWLKVAGTFTNNGTITEASSGTHYIEFNGTSAQNVTIGTLTGEYSYILRNNAGINLTGTMTIAAAQSLDIISTSSTPITGGTVTYATGTTTLKYTGTGNKTVTDKEFPATNGPAVFTINNTGAQGSNQVTFGVTGNRTVPSTGTMNMTAGVLILGNNDLDVQGAFVPGTSSVNNIIVTNGTGQFKKLFSSATTVTFPFGDITGTQEQSYLTFGFSSLTGNRTIGMRVIDGQNTNDGTASNPMTRYWVFTDDAVGTGSYVATMTLNYGAADMTAASPQSYRISRWNGTAWANIGSVPTATSATNLANTMITNDLMNGEYTLRPATITTYTWNTAAGGVWGTSTNWTPTRSLVDPGDILVFDGTTTTGSSTGSPIVVTAVPAEQMGQLKLQNNVFVALQGGAANTLTLNGDTGDDLTIPAGSELKLNGASALTLTYANSGNTANLLGTLTLAGSTSNKYDCVSAATSVTTIGSTGIFNNGGTVSNGSSTALLFNAGSTYNHTRDGGTIPDGAWDATSMINLTGLVLSLPSLAGTSGTQSYGHFTVNSSGLTSTANSVLAGALTIKGNVNITNTNTGNFAFGGSTLVLTVNGTTTIASTGDLRLSTSSSNGAILNFNGGITINGKISTSTGGITVNTTDFVQNTGSTIISSLTTTNAITFNITGTFNQAGGTFTDNATSTGVVAIKFNGTTAQNVTLSGTNSNAFEYTINNPAGINLTGTMNINGNTAYGSGGLVMTQGTITGSGSVVYAGTPGATASVSRLVYNGTAAQTATAKEFPSTGGPNSLTINNAAGVSLPFARTVDGYLVLTSGNLNIGANNFTLGSGTTTTTIGILTYTAGSVTMDAGGGFTRWYAASSNPTSAGGDKGNYPVAITGGSSRQLQMYFSSGTFTAGGTITVSTAGGGGTTPASFTDVVNVARITNGYWVITTGNSINMAAVTCALKISPTSMASVGATTNLRITQAAGALGTHTAATGTTTTPILVRTLILNANFATTYYMAGDASSFGKTATTTGNWGDAATWDGSSVPVSTDDVSIAAGVTVNTGGVSANTCKNLDNSGTLTISDGAMALTVTGTLTNSSTGTLNVSGGNATASSTLTNNNILNVTSGSLTVTGAVTNSSGKTMNVSGGTFAMSNDLTNTGTTTISGGTVTITGSAGAAGLTTGVLGALNVSSGTIRLGAANGGNRKFTSNGTLGITGGTVEINGNLVFGNGATFNMSGGTLLLDPNDGTSAGSVASSTHTIATTSSAALNGTVSGGTILFNDPPYQGTGSSFYYASNVNLNWAGNTMQFGGSTGTNSLDVTNTVGFKVECGAISNRVKLGHVIVNGNDATKFVSDASTGGISIGGNLTVNSNSEIRYSANSGYNTVAGNIVNNGTISTVTTLNLSDITGPSTLTANPNAQTISGSGTFRNLTSSPTANFGSLNINNSSAAGVTFANNVQVSGAFTQTVGITNMGANTLTIGTSTSSLGTWYYTAGRIVGKAKKWFSAPLPYASLFFPIGTTTTDRTASLVFSSVNVSTGGTLTAEFKSTSIGATGLPRSINGQTIDAVSPTGYWQIDATDGFDLGSVTYNASFDATGFKGVNGTDPLSLLSGLRVIKRSSSAADWTDASATAATAAPTALNAISITAQNSFSVFALGGTSAALPIELKSFSAAAKGNVNAIQWTTASEKNTSKFIVERSATGVNDWKSIGEVKAAGNSNQLLNYDLNDNAPFALSYYRLKSVDLDGKFQHSKVVSVQRKGDQFTLWGAFPVPFDEQVTVRYELVETGDVTVRLTDLTGKVMMERVISGQEGLNEYSLPTENLAAGVYMIHLNNASSRSNIVKIVKQ